MFDRVMAPIARFMPFEWTWNVSANVRIALAVIFVALMMGTLTRLVAVRRADAEVAAKRLASLRTWWIIAVSFGLAIVFGKIGVILFFALVSVLALREYVTLAAVPYDSWGLVGWAYLLLALNYVTLACGEIALFKVLLPLVGLLLIAVRMVMREQSKGYLLTGSSLYWGLILTVYCVSHAALLMTLPATTNPVAGAAGWLLYLVLLTELSDISQALVGRRLGRHAIAPVLSPHKTWEGLIGGVLITMAAAVLAAPSLTSLADARLSLGRYEVALPHVPAMLTGLVIGVAGYFGDLNISGIKRDLGVKDSGRLLPGQGGILDRIDSLTFTAPVFYYWIRFLVLS